MMPGFQRPRRKFGACSLGDFIYAFGGFDSKSILVFRFDVNKWQKIDLELPYDKFYRIEAYPFKDSIYVLTKRLIRHDNEEYPIFKVSLSHDREGRYEHAWIPYDIQRVGSIVDYFAWQGNYEVEGNTLRVIGGEEEYSLETKQIKGPAMPKRSKQVGYEMGEWPRLLVKQ